MQGRMVLKITGILMIIAAAFSILAGIFVGGLGALAAGVGAASGLTGAYWAALFLTLVGEYHKEHRDLGFYADRMCLTPKYLSHAVNKASGKTAAQWITEAVILESIRFFHFLCP